VIMHCGVAHVRDADDYSNEISAVLREAQALNFPP